MTDAWLATMIAADSDFDGAPLFRKPFSLDSGHGAIVSAKLRATSLGIYEGYINGRPVGDDVLSPGWSSYEWRVRYRSYDVAGLLATENVIALALGNGWYRGRLGWFGQDCLYGDELGAFAQLDIRFADGHRQVVATDESWRAGPSSTTANSIYDGQLIDARREPTGWATPGFDDTGWVGVHRLDLDLGRLATPIADAVVRYESLKPQEIWESPQGKTLIDFGQNLVGWLRFNVQGPAGQAITIRHAEVLEHAELGVRPLRDAQATDTFILSGGQDSFEPTKTFHGFRYAEVDGWPGELTKDSLEAVVVHSRLNRIGHFESSHSALNQLHRNVVWGLRGNFVDLPTDCPQRNERLGWTGDIAVFAPTAAFLYDVKGFLQDWLVDLWAEQKATGYVPVVVPDALKLQRGETRTALADFGLSPATAIWGDAAVWVPWAVWEAYGDRTVLERQFDSMVVHVRSAEALLSPSGLWDQGGQFADWLDPDAPPDKPADAKADKGVVSTASLFRSARMVAAAADVLGRADEVAEFGLLAERLRSAFVQHYVNDDGTILSDCATVYALAIAFDLLEPSARDRAGERLAKLVAEGDYRVTTGFAGTPYICDALSSTGHLDAAYRLLLERECPSWLYPVSMGATTIWERWDSMLPDGTINPGEMTSFNHYALGAVADWMHRVIGGLTAVEPGYSRVRIAPRPGGDISWARISLQTPHGLISVSWEINGNELRLNAELPESVTAEVALEGSAPVVVTGGHHRLSSPWPAPVAMSSSREGGFSG